jgi:hypothetical protein
MKYSYRRAAGKARTFSNSLSFTSQLMPASELAPCSRQTTSHLVSKARRCTDKTLSADYQGWWRRHEDRRRGITSSVVRYHPWLTREDIVRLVLTLVRIGLLLVLTVMTLSLVIAVGRPETGPFEKFVLVAIAAGLIGLAIPVGRIARNR